MKTPTLKFRKPQEKVVAAEDIPEESPAAALSWTGGTARLTSAITYLLISCLIAGPLALLGVGYIVYSSTSAQAPTPVKAGDSAAVVDDRAAVSSFAEDFVVTWLTSSDGQEKQLAAFLPDFASVTLPKTPWAATAPATAGLEQTEDGTWSVTVAVTVSAPQQPAVRRFFQVPVADVDDALVATSLPAPVAANDRAAEVRLDYRYRITQADPAAVAAGEFLNAMLAGAGDVTRFISPGSTIRAVVPAPYTAIKLDEVLVDQNRAESPGTPETGDQLRMLTTAVATVSAAQEISIAYAITLTARAGRWEVTSIDPAPRLLPTQPSPTQPSPTPGSPSVSTPTSPSTTTN